MRWRRGGARSEEFQKVSGGRWRHVAPPQVRGPSPEPVRRGVSLRQARWRRSAASERVRRSPRAGYKVRLMVRSDSTEPLPCARMPSPDRFPNLLEGYRLSGDEHSSAARSPPLNDATACWRPLPQLNRLTASGTPPRTPVRRFEVEHRPAE